MTTKNVINRYRVKDNSICTCCNENQAIWYDRPCNDDHQYFMCMRCLKEIYTIEGEIVEYHEEDLFQNDSYDLDQEPPESVTEDFNSEEELQTHEEEEDGDITDQFMVGSFLIHEHSQSKWEFGKGICSLGGCETDILSFTEKQEAIREAERLTNEGIEPEVGYPCSTCLKDYF